MNINNKFNNAQDITLASYLNAYGIMDVEEFVNPKGKYLDNPLNYNNIDTAIMWLEYLRNKPHTKVGLIQDADADGVMSSALAYMFLRHLGFAKEDVMVFFHQHKTHGLTDAMMGSILNNQCEYLWICDAGTNDAEQCEFLSDMGVNVLITDHHIQDTDNNNAVIVNNHNSPNINNKHLCGTGVTFQVIRAYCEKHNDDWYQDKLDMVAMANIADVMSMANYENRWINSWGLKYINNPLLQAMCKQFVRGDVLTPKDIAFSIAPKFNSLCRSDNQELKEKVFYALCGEDPNVHDVTLALRQCHDKQTRDVKAIYDKLMAKEPTIINNVVIQTLDKSTPYTGLVANKLLSHYNRPIMLVHDNGKGFLSGSCRSPIPFREYLDNSGAMTFARGHDSAFGIGYAQDKFSTLVEYLNTTPLDITPTKDVTCTVNSIMEVPNALYELGDRYKELWGHDIPAPLVYIPNVCINSKEIKELGGNTIKFKLGMIDVLKFACSNAFKEEMGVGDSKWLNMNLILSPSLNEWNGNVSKQMLIEEIEII